MIFSCPAKAFPPPPCIFGIFSPNLYTPQFSRLTPRADPLQLVNTEISGFTNGAVNNGTGSSPFDDYAPWNGMKRVTDAEAGELVSIPKYWYKWTLGGQTLSLYIATQPVDGFFVSPAHADRGDGKGERDVVYVGRYHCASDWKSKTGVDPHTTFMRSDGRSSIHNLGSTIWQWDLAMVWTIRMLYLMEVANGDSQQYIGRGCGNDINVQNMGYTDSMQYHTGTTQVNRDTYGLGTQYRYIEGLWDNVLDWVDGCYCDSNGLNVILNPSQFSDDVGGELVHGDVDNLTDVEISEKCGVQWVYITSDMTHDFSYLTSSLPCVCVGASYEQTDEYGFFSSESQPADEEVLEWGERIGTRLMKLP